MWGLRFDGRFDFRIRMYGQFTHFRAWTGQMAMVEYGMDCLMSDEWACCSSECCVRVWENSNRLGFKIEQRASRVALHILGEGLHTGGKTEMTVTDIHDVPS